MMMETELCSSRVLSPPRYESGDEELSVLPRHTKVIVTGNNRTKSVLVGLQGVVKKAVGLGGWHWLRVNLTKLGTPTLWRYWKHFNLVILGFIQAAKRLKTLYRS
uniref:Uncharacterized protein n=2 Tax=Oryza TaxID=4527 RepID=A0A0E0DAR3_9ORYZ